MSGQANVQASGQGKPPAPASPKRMVANVLILMRPVVILSSQAQHIRQGQEGWEFEVLENGVKVSRFDGQGALHSAFLPWSSVVYVTYVEA